MASSSNDFIPSLRSNGTETLPSIMSDKSYTNTCRILDYLKGLSDQVGKLGGEVTQLATFGTELRHSAHVANMTTGAVQSWQNEMSGYFDPKLIFTLANNALEDKGTRENLMKLGVDKKTLQTHDVDKISQAIIRKLPEYYKNNQTDALAKFHSLGFDPYGFYRDIARGLFNLPKGELDNTLDNMNKKREKENLSINDTNLKAAQDAGKSINFTRSVINTEKTKNGYKGLSELAKALRGGTEYIDQNIIDFDQKTNSTDGKGYAFLDASIRAIWPAIKITKDVVCSTTFKKKDKKSSSGDKEHPSSLKGTTLPKIIAPQLPQKFPDQKQNNNTLNGEKKSLPLNQINPHHENSNDNKKLPSSLVPSILLNLNDLPMSFLLSIPLIKEDIDEIINKLKNNIINTKPNENYFLKNKLNNSPFFILRNPPLGAISDPNAKTNHLPERVPSSSGTASPFPSVFLNSSKNTTHASQAPQGPNPPLIDDRSFVVQIYNQTGQDFSAAAVASRTA